MVNSTTNIGSPQMNTLSGVQGSDNVGQMGDRTVAEGPQRPAESLFSKIGNSIKSFFSAIGDKISTWQANRAEAAQVKREAKMDAQINQLGQKAARMLGGGGGDLTTTLKTLMARAETRHGEGGAKMAGEAIMKGIATLPEERQDGAKRLIDSFHSAGTGQNGVGILVKQEFANNVDRLQMMHESLDLGDGAMDYSGMKRDFNAKIDRLGDSLQASLQVLDRQSEVDNAANALIEGTASPEIKELFLKHAEAMHGSENAKFLFAAQDFLAEMQETGVDGMTDRFNEVFDEFVLIRPYTGFGGGGDTEINIPSSMYEPLLAVRNGEAELTADVFAGALTEVMGMIKGDLLGQTKGKQWAANPAVQAYVQTGRVDD